MRNVHSLPPAPTGLGIGGPNAASPGTGLSGPRGIEAVIEYNNLYLNVRSWIDTYLVTTIGGIDDADIRDSREVNPGYHGETPFPGYYGGRTITLNGKIITKTLFKLRDMQQALRQAFAPLDRERPLIFRGSTPEQDLLIYCKKSQSIQMADEQRTANHFERPFLITLRASNPRFVSSLREWATKAFPGATFDAIAMTLINLGNFEAQPEIELKGPMSTLTLTNEANGDWMRLTGAIPTGETWVVNAKDRRMYRKSDGAYRFQYLDVNSDWMMIEPGLNNIRVTATGLTTNSSVDIFYNHTVM
jgi:Siphovirus-type tail component, C-terminal domain/Phage tail protein RIFT-related domain